MDSHAAGAVTGALLSYPCEPGSAPGQPGLSDLELEDWLRGQLDAGADRARRAGGRLAWARCQGELALDLAVDGRTAQVVARTLARFDALLSLHCPVPSTGAQVARDCGVRVLPL